MDTPVLNKAQFNDLFPFYLVVDEQLSIRQVGKSLQKVFPHLPGRDFYAEFEFTRPNIETRNFEELRSVAGLIIIRPIRHPSLLLRGQVQFLENQKSILFVLNPWFRSMEEVMQHNLNLNDFSLSDPMIDLLHILKAEEIVTQEVKELLEKVRRQREKSDELAQRMNSLFEYASEGILLADSKGAIVMANPAAVTLFQYPKAELEGMRVENLMPERFVAAHEHNRHQFLKETEARRMGKGRELMALNKAGREFPVEISLSPFVNNNEQFVIAFVIDISRRKEAERDVLLQKDKLEKATIEVRKLNTELEAKVEERTTILKEALLRLEQSQEELSEALDKERQLNEIKSRFVSMASHEFRTPLSTMLSSANLIKKYDKPEDQPKRERHINKITGSIHHLNILLEDFLSLGKLDEGKFSTNIIPLVLEDTITDTISEMEGQLKEGQQIIYEHNGSHTFACDKSLLKNILINLISNSIKFSDKGKDIRIISSYDGGFARVSVQDQGIGISAEDQVHLFSSFFRGKNAVNIQGTGLGLNIVKKYLEMLGGSIEIVSALGKGTTITFSLPIKS